MPSIRRGPDYMMRTLLLGACVSALATSAFAQADPDAPKGKLPFQIPSSMEAVVANLPDVPGDTSDPAFEFGDGLRYEVWTPSPAPTDDDRASTRNARTARFDLSTASLADVMDDPDGGAILTEYLPGFEQMPMLDMVRNMPFGVVLDMAAGSAPAEHIQALKDTLQAVR